MYLPMQIVGDIAGYLTRPNVRADDSRQSRLRHQPPCCRPHLRFNTRPPWTQRRANTWPCSASPAPTSTDCTAGRSTSSAPPNPQPLRLRRPHVARNRTPSHRRRPLPSIFPTLRYHPPHRHQCAPPIATMMRAPPRASAPARPSPPASR
jgi:hypothetical protein